MECTKLTQLKCAIFSLTSIQMILPLLKLGWQNTFTLMSYFFVATVFYVKTEMGGEEECYWFSRIQLCSRNYLPPMIWKFFWLKLLLAISILSFDWLTDPQLHRTVWHIIVILPALCWQFNRSVILWRLKPSWFWLEHLQWLLRCFSMHAEMVYNLILIQLITSPTHIASNILDVILFNCDYCLNIVIHLNLPPGLLQITT